MPINVPLKNQLRIGNWVVSPDTNSLVRNGVSHSIQPLSMNILLHLASRPGDVVTTQELLEKFWEKRIVGDDAVHRRIADLRRQLGDDAKDPEYIDTISKRGYRLVAEVEVLPPETVQDRLQARRNRSLSAAGILALFAVAALAFYLVQVDSRESQRAAAIERAGQFLEDDRYQDAYFALEPFVGASDPQIKVLLDATSLTVSVNTDPQNIIVSYRYPGRDTAWRDLGRTPVVDVRLARGNVKLKLGDDILMNATNPGPTFNNVDQSERIIEMPLGEIPPDMVFVPGGRYRLGAWGFDEETDLGGFLIDRTEVTNGEYFEFLQSDEYGSLAFWQPLIDMSGGELSITAVRDLFVDRTERPGPAGWELGSFTPGQRDFPVVGISWFEASAYLSYRGKMLPSVHHWLRTALGPMEWKYPFAPELVPQSNIDGDTLLAVGSRVGAESFGAYDLIGNANEWTASESRGIKAVIGSSFRDPVWSYNFPSSVDPFSRGDDIGFRGMRQTTQSLPVPLPAVALFDDFSSSIRHVSDEMFAGMRLIYAYDEGTMTAADVKTVAEVESDHWIRRQVTMPTARDGDPMTVYLYMPRNHKPPYQSVIYLPPADSWSPGIRSKSIALEDYQIDFVPRSGRVLVWPVYSGSYERYDGLHAAVGSERGVLALDRNRRIRDEIGRIIDYLESDVQFDGTRVALMGLSHGAIISSYNLATEDRLKAAILYSIGVAPPSPVFSNPQNDPNVFWARVTQPTLIINGRYDPIRPQQFVLEPLVQLLATPPEHRKSLLYESAHWPLPRFQMMRDSLEWLDHYLGPVDAAVTPN